MTYRNAAKFSTAASRPTSRCRRCRCQHAQQFHNRCVRLRLRYIYRHEPARPVRRYRPCCRRRLPTWNNRRITTATPATPAATTSSTKPRTKNSHSGCLLRVPEKKDQGSYTPLTFFFSPIPTSNPSPISPPVPPSHTTPLFFSHWRRSTPFSFFLSLVVVAPAYPSHSPSSPIMSCAPSLCGSHKRNSISSFFFFFFFKKFPELPESHTRDLMGKMTGRKKGRSFHYGRTEPRTTVPSGASMLKKDDKRKLFPIFTAKLFLFGSFIFYISLFFFPLKNKSLNRVIHTFLSHKPLPFPLPFSFTWIYLPSAPRISSPNSPLPPTDKLK
ncbi:hypothetical protein B0J12DRAFT_369497 [Macrophomina phaseolina]|uniref:Uncharacterized protein n=1 Tax=Macrophomina phaseolina TaxID=35725 RepID=A0ABQ8GJS4_9PEZI|nr:hypothetical protein B0J12DRAFT_369497 [Macrophomina phaseolina]